MVKSTTAIPTVLAFQRGLNISDAVMLNIFFNKEDGDSAVEKFNKIHVIRHGIRGVLGDRKAAVKKKVDGSEKESTANVQKTESAKTAVEAGGMAIEFSIRPASLKTLITSCNVPEYKKQLNVLIKNLTDSASLQEVCNRYARNILNGRWMWRNLILGSKMKIRVMWGVSESVDVSGFRMGTEFGDGVYDEQEKKLGSALADVFAGRSRFDFKVIGKIYFESTGSFEVFPSQNFVSDKPKGFARPLYKLTPPTLSSMIDMSKNNESPDNFIDQVDMGPAGIRDQKIGNAIRTIDTWYQERSVDGDPVEPIAIEPNGASLASNEFHRKVNNAFKLFDDIDNVVSTSSSKKNQIDIDLAYLCAIIIRGGVFGAEKKDAKAPKTKAGKGKDAEADAEIDSAATTSDAEVEDQA
jgi:CRISPR-associated protein Csy3